MKTVPTFEKWVSQQLRTSRWSVGREPSAHGKTIPPETLDSLRKEYAALYPPQTVEGTPSLH